MIRPKIFHNATLTSAVYEGVRGIFVPIARIALRFNLDSGALSDALQSAFVQVADEEYGDDGKPANDTEIQAATGLPRKLIPTIRARPKLDCSSNYLARVVGLWTADERYCRESGGPSPLPFRAVGTPSFWSLVKTIGRDLSPRAVLDLMLSDGIAEMTANDQILLREPGTHRTKDLHAIISASCRSIAFHFEGFLKNMKLLAEGTGSLRSVNRKRWSDRIPQHKVKIVDRRVREILERAEDEVRKVLDEAEVSRESVGLVLMGAGFYSFIRSKDGSKTL